MSINDLEKGIKILIQNQNIITSKLKVINEEIIEKAEKYLDIVFPKTYQKFIKTYGYISLGGQEIYGVLNDEFINSGIPNAIWLTYNNRKDFNFPHHLIPIYDVGEGTTYCLDTSQINAEGECPVVAWPIDGYEATPVLEIVAEDFGKFFLDMVQQEVDYKKKKQQ